MQPSDNFEKRLQGTPLPSHQNRLHRESLKQALLAELQKENAMAEKTGPANGTNPLKLDARQKQRVSWPRWLKVGAAVAAVLTIAVVSTFATKTSGLFDRSFPNEMKQQWAATRPATAGIRSSDLSDGGEVRKRDKSDLGLLKGTPSPNKQLRLAEPVDQQLLADSDADIALGGLGPNHPELAKLPALRAIRAAGGKNDPAGGLAFPLPGLPGAPEPPPTGDDYSPKADNPFHKPAQTPLSTFSIDVDTASYSNARRFLLQENQMPPKDAVRIEELVNYFHYDDPAPKDGKPVAINTEVGPCPWNAKHRLVRIGLRATSIDPEQSPARNLVFLVDTSGSMQSPDRLPLLKKGLAMLVETLRPMDRVAIVAYAGSAGLVLPSLPGTEKKQILEAIDRLESGGSTNGGQGIELAYAIAMANIIPKGVNRVILGTDGDFNVGVTSQGDLVRMIEEKRKSGVFLSVLGFGHGNLKDHTMEQLAHHGNGHYAYIDTLEEARRLFVEQGAALQVVAGDVKVQVEFNPAKVAAYRLVGYENRLMKDQDFNDDKKDAGDMGSGHSVTALYEIVPVGVKTDVPAVDPLRYQDQPKLAPAAGSGELMTVKVRYKEPGEEKSKLISQPVVDGDRPLDKTSVDFRFAAAVAEFALLLKDSPHRGTGSYDNVLRQARGSVGADPHGHRAAFIEMVQAAQRLSRAEKPAQ